MSCPLQQASCDTPHKSSWMTIERKLRVKLKGYKVEFGKEELIIVEDQRKKEFKDSVPDYNAREGAHRHKREKLRSWFEYQHASVMAAARALNVSAEMTGEPISVSLVLWAEEHAGVYSFEDGFDKGVLRM